VNDTRRAAELHVDLRRRRRLRGSAPGAPVVPGCGIS